ncbi:hypothetical protein [Sporolactobacillus shoreicorticis]|nr:hypothetical protein [Sporolactobacillus shoreicorticis]
MADIQFGRRLPNTALKKDKEAEIEYPFCFGAMKRARQSPK